MKGTLQIPHPTQTAVAQLARSAPGPVVSVYVPVGPAGRDAELATRRRRAAQTARDLLVDEWGLDPVDAGQFVAALTTGPSPFDPSSRGGAWFIDRNETRTLSFPVPVGPAVEVGETADLLRVLPFLDAGPEYVALALSQKRARAFEGDRYRIAPLTVAGMPRDLHDAVWYRVREPQLSRHGSGALHGTGGAPDAHKADVQEFVHQLHRALEPVVRTLDRPLVVIGVGYEAAMLVNEFDPVLAVAVPGNPDHLDAAELRQLSWEAAKTTDESALNAAAAACELAGTGKAVLVPTEVADAAQNGMLRELVVARSLTTGNHAGNGDDYPLIARAVSAAVAAGVPIHVVDPATMPTGTVIAGILHY